MPAELTGVSAMRDFRTEVLSQLAHELTIAPARHRERYFRGARQAIELLQPDRDYPRSFILFQVTGYRTRQTVEIEVSGGDAIADLVLLIESLTLDTPLPTPDDAAETLLDAVGLCSRWNISSRTLDRWRASGLVACWYAAADAPARLLFSLDDVQRFEKRHAHRVQRAAQFRPVTDDERRELARLALAAMAAEGCSLSEAVRRVAERTGRAPETVRLAVHKSRALIGAARDSDASTDGWCDGAEPAAPLAQRYREARGAERTALLQARAAELAHAPIRYVFAPEFDHPNAERLIMTDPPARAASSPQPNVPADLPAYVRELFRTPLLSAEEERTLFRRYNYLLHKAEQSRRLIDPPTATEATIEHIESLLEQAAAVKQHIAQANLRLVVSIARRHQGHTARLDLYDLIGEGNLILMRVIETFDVSRGNKFSTYATWAVTRQFTRLVAESWRDCERLHVDADAPCFTAEPAAPVESMPDADESRAARLLQTVLADLDPRERDIVARRFGLSDYQPQSLAQVSEAVHLSRERVRQIEKRTLSKLRQALILHDVAVPV